MRRDSIGNVSMGMTAAEDNRMPTEPASQAAVKRALDQEELLLFYQPIHEIDSRKIVAAEALLRAERANGEIREAASIAAAAEEGPNLFRLDSWLLRQALDDAARWQSKYEEIRININLSPREFEEGNLVERFEKLVGVCHANAEITETAYIEKPEDAVETVVALRKMGVEIWLDDFGTGHSSISHLLHFPLDGLKLPAEFVKGVAGDDRSRAIVRSIIGVAHELEMRVIAEGVEHDDQLAFLRDEGCDYIQGFLFSKPMPIEKFEQALTRS
jgi:EAL domain-containing protein (putative c-di-GMP-specific phosphodiesterase class I)